MPLKKVLKFDAPSGSFGNTWLTIELASGKVLKQLWRAEGLYTKGNLLTYFQDR